MKPLLGLVLGLAASSAHAEGRHDTVLSCTFDDLQITIRQDGGEGFEWLDTQRFPQPVTARISRSEDRITVTPIGVMDLEATITIEARDKVAPDTAATYHVSGMGLPAETLHGTCEEPV
ncbi:hypothetical protein [Thioclava kandeliae]|uniref:Uncharacterized protein n=1 Tax=Thioclava kandeliae TaxID=3070818 RepID=A0ABV1SBG0_9RHOB